MVFWFEISCLGSVLVVVGLEVVDFGLLVGGEFFVVRIDGVVYVVVDGVNIGLVGVGVMVDRVVGRSGGLGGGVGDGVIGIGVVVLEGVVEIELVINFVGGGVVEVVVGGVVVRGGVIEDGVVVVDVSGGVGWGSGGEVVVF